MDEPRDDSTKEPGPRRGRGAASVLWWIAAGLSLLATALEYINTGKVGAYHVVLTIALLLLAITIQRAKTR